VSELENEANELRRQLQTSETNHKYTASLPVAAQVPETGMSNDSSRTNEFTPGSATGYPTTYIQAALTPITLEGQPSTSENSSRLDDPALTRTLNGKTVEGYEIDDLFEL
jgi:hypothetical protein